MQRTHGSMLPLNRGLLSECYHMRSHLCPLFYFFIFSLRHLPQVAVECSRKCFEPVPWEWYEGENYKHETSDAPVG
jgi:hypothetical protein